MIKTIIRFEFRRGRALGQERTERETLVTLAGHFRRPPCRPSMSLKIAVQVPMITTKSMVVILFSNINYVCGSRRRRFSPATLGFLGFYYCSHSSTALCTLVSSLHQLRVWCLFIMLSILRINVFLSLL